MPQHFPAVPLYDFEQSPPGAQQAWQGVSTGFVSCARVALRETKRQANRSMTRPSKVWWWRWQPSWPPWTNFVSLARRYVGINM
eukprot:scaffold11311_cov52-Phaeocystis_antarctica.AAC.4